MAKPGSLIKTNVVVTAGHILIYLQGILLMPIIIKTVGVSVYGGYTLLVSMVGIVYSVSSLGVGFKCLRFLPSAATREARQELFFPQMTFQLASLALLSLLLLLLSPVLKGLFFKDDIAFSMYLVVAYLMTYQFFYQSNNYFRNTHRVSYSITQSVLSCYINILLVSVTALFYHKLDVNMLFATLVFATLLVTGPLVALMIKEIGFKLKFSPLRDLLADIKHGFPLVVSYLVDIVLNTGDRYIIALFLSVKYVGYYNPGYTLGTLIILFPKSFGMVLPQLLAKYVDRGELAAARSVVNATLKFYLLLAIPFLVGGAVLSRPLLTLLANEDVANHAYLITPVVALGTLFYGLNVILTNVLFVNMKTRAMLNLNLVGSLVNLALNLLLFCFFKNIMVAAVTTLVSYAVMFFLMRRAVLCDWPVDFGPATIVKASLAAASMGFCLWLMSHYLTFRAPQSACLVAEICAGTVVYLLGLGILRAVSRDELAQLLGAIGKRKPAGAVSR